MRLRRTLVWLCIVMAFLGPVGLVGLYLLVDEGPPADADLRTARLEAPEAENGFSLLDLGGEQFRLPEGDEEEEACEPFGKGWDPAVAARYLKDDESPRVVEEVLARPQFQAPLMSFDTPIPYLRVWRAIAQLGAMRVAALHEEGKDGEAFDQAMKIVRLGKKMESSDGWAIHHVMGMSAKGRGVEALIMLLERTRLEPAALRPTFSELSRHRCRREEVVRILKNEYLGMAELIDRGFDGQFPYPQVPRAVFWALFRPNQTRRLLADAQRETIRLLLDLNGERMHLGRDELPAGPEVSWNMRNRFGKSLLRQIIPVDTLFSKTASSNLDISFAEALFALKCFHHSRGKLPGSLEELVPEFWHEVPPDPYDGKPLRYSREKRIIYSVGEDLVDSGGSQAEGPDETRRDKLEPTFMIAWE